MKPGDSVQLWLIVCTASLLTVGMVTYGSGVYGETFFSSFLSNWYSTFLGVIVGIPFAMWVGGIQERATEKEKKTKILRLLRDELVLNYDYVQTYLDKREDQGILIGQMGDYLKDELWRALSDGGDLQWIKDPVLLSELSYSYYEIRVLCTLSRKYFELTQFATEETSSKVTSKVYTNFGMSVVKAHQQIDQNLRTIEKMLGIPPERPLI